MCYIIIIRKNLVDIKISIIFIVAALLEVAGDAIIRKGLKFNSITQIAFGFVLLGCYGLIVNMVKWDFSKLLGVYIAVFAMISILAGALYFKETIPLSTWVGLGIITVGGLVIQFKVFG